MQITVKYPKKEKSDGESRHRIRERMFPCPMAANATAQAVKKIGFQQDTALHAAMSVIARSQDL